ncbi:MAG: hypothetical protein J0H74_20700 [Chitinophagaceae bacterium]|nr:hypothetical protein [Chitinophagaceae bacterium]
MLRTIASVCLIILNFTLCAQTDELGQLASRLDKTKDVKGYQQLAESFSRIADTRKTDWLPYYYAAFCNARVGWLYQDEGEQIEPYADKGQEQINKALSLLDTSRQKKELSEVYCVLSMVNRARVYINPATYGRKFGPLASRYIQMAKAANPDNPRALYLEGWEKYFTPKMWGGDKAKAKEILQAAKQKFDGQGVGGAGQPHWGRQDVEDLLAKK